MGLDRRRVASRAGHWRSLLAAVAAAAVLQALPESPWLPVTLAATPAIAAHGDHTCALDKGGSIHCWGDNRSGVLGNAYPFTRTTPAPVSGLTSSVVAIAGGTYHTCAMVSQGPGLPPANDCWGENSVGQLMSPPNTLSSVPVRTSVPGLGVEAVVAGGGHTCVRVANGAVFCRGTYPAVGDFTALASLTDTTALAAGEDHTCVLTRDGAVKCWGGNTYGQLGDGTTTSRAIPVPVSGLSSGVTAIAARAYHTCAVNVGGTVVCWGRNDYGQLGDGTKTQRSSPVAVSGLPTGAIAVATGLQHSCALLADSGVRCWGRNDVGQLGDGSQDDRLAPVATRNLGSGVVAVSSGESHTCARKTDASLHCWGSNRFGQLGDGTRDYRTEPTAVTGLPSGAASVGTGGYHTCAVTLNGAAYCWGNDNSGQLGNGRETGISVPGPVSGLPGVAAKLATGFLHSCALTSSGGAYCWGEGGQGQLGQGRYESSSVAVPVTGMGSGVAAIATGVYHTCATTVAGTLWCWGDNKRGELGTGNLVASNVPVTVPGLPAVDGIAAGLGNTCALTREGAVWCWGSNERGQLGNGTTTPSTTPVAVSGMASGVSAISLGYGYACALTAARQVKCWGLNADGRLGDGTTTDRSTPTAVAGLPADIVAISVGASHACALSASGSVFCWGGSAGSAVPVPIADLPSDIVAIAAGRQHTCAQGRTGNLWCWGVNSTGPLGDGTFAERLSPAVTVRPGGGGSIGAGDWFLDLDPDTATTIPSAKIPPYLVVTSGNAATPVVTVATDVSFRPSDAGRRIYVFGYVPDTLAGLRETTKAEGQCVLAQVDASGRLVTLVGAALTAYEASVGSAQTQAVNILTNMPASNVAGGTFCVGTGSTPAQALDTANSRCVATIPGAVACLPPDATTPEPVAALVLLGGPAASVHGSPVTFEATVVGDAPTGQVTFRDGATAIGTAALDSGIAALTVSTLAVGSHAITADYAGDHRNRPAASAPLAHQVNAPATVALAVAKSGSGSGTVKSSPAGIDCGATCSASFPAGSSVTLTATADAGSRFDGWTGACSGAGACSLRLDAAVSVDAAFGKLAAARLGNLATRAPVLADDRVMIAGFTIRGSAPKKVLITARGPSLAALGVPGTLGNPMLRLYSGATMIADNDDWGGNANAAEIAATGLAPANALESALLLSLDPGQYTAIVAGADHTTGIGIVEAFETDRPDVPLVNIATRATVLTGDNVLIGGFTIEGEAPMQVLVTARGPSLSAHGVTGALADPALIIHSGATVVAANDDWVTDTNAAAIAASGVGPGHPREAALLVTLAPGPYTAIVVGEEGATGIAIVEFFALP